MASHDMWDRMRRMHDEMDRLFEDFFSGPSLLALPSGNKALKEGEASGKQVLFREVEHRAERFCDAHRQLDSA